MKILTLIGAIALSLFASVTVFTSLSTESKTVTPHLSTESITVTPHQSDNVVYRAGEHYTVVNTGMVSDGVVREYMSFYCPHCYKFESLARRITKEIGDKYVFEKNHVDFLRMADIEDQKSLTQAYYVAKFLGADVEIKFSKFIFEKIHLERDKDISSDDILLAFKSAGVSEKIFVNTLVNERVISDLDDARARQKSLVDTGGINSVPTFVINGKYRINFMALDKGDFEGDMIGLVKFLLTLPSK
jgi:thiol:disulfide interchange protein DsbA